jgi:glycosyltransferase involved in cell wall biosynthesis
MQPWEFGSIPADWAKATASVDQVWCYTRYVRDLYIAAGVPDSKLRILPLGIDPALHRPEAVPFALKTSKSFRFLFVGGTIGRKGADLLLDIYLRTFRRSDDVCLVIKDFGGGSVYAGQTLEVGLGMSHLGHLRQIVLTGPCERGAPALRGAQRVVWQAFTLGGRGGSTKNAPRRVKRVKASETIVVKLSTLSISLCEITHGRPVSLAPRSPRRLALRLFSA